MRSSSTKATFKFPDASQIYKHKALDQQEYYSPKFKEINFVTSDCDIGSESVHSEGKSIPVSEN